MRSWRDHVHHPYQMRSAAGGIRYRPPRANADEPGDLVSSAQDLWENIGKSGWYLPYKTCSSEYFSFAREGKETGRGEWRERERRESLLSLSLSLSYLQEWFYRRTNETLAPSESHSPIVRGLSWWNIFINIFLTETYSSILKVDVIWAIKKFLDHIRKENSLVPFEIYQSSINQKLI